MQWGPSWAALGTSVALFELLSRWNCRSECTDCKSKCMSEIIGAKPKDKC